MILYGIQNPEFVNLHKGFEALNFVILYGILYGKGTRFSTINTNIIQQELDLCQSHKKAAHSYAEQTAFVVEHMGLEPMTSTLPV